MDTTSSFNDIQLLECSRRSSVQKLSGNTENNAIFTNKLDSGVELKVGDEVSIHSAIVSERGAGNETIELKGNVIGQVVRNVTDIKTYTASDSFKNNGYLLVLNREDAVDINNEDVTLDVKDNQVNMTIEYYKATNGENCFSLPRRFAGASEKYLDPQWKYDDGFQTGAMFRCQRNGTIIETDYQRDRNASSPWTNSWLTNKELLKVRQDGTKYTIFSRQGPTFYGINSSIPTGIPSFPYLEATIDNMENGNGSVDPAVDNYAIYKELKTVEVPKGRRSADFIAETFTNSLQNASTLEGYDFWKTSNNPSTADVYSNQGQLAGVYKTDTFKPFNCGSGFNFSSGAFKLAMNYDFSPPLSQFVLDWANCFQNVAFKRPEYVEAGRVNLGRPSLLTSGPDNWIVDVSDDRSSQRTKMEITINIDYNASNCLKVHNFFKTQKIYPEMWDFRNGSDPYYNKGLTRDNSRFLHIDMIQAYDHPDKTKAVPRKEIGSDCYFGDKNTDPTNASDLNNMIRYDTPSQPIFFTFLKEDENTFYTNPNNERLSYGTMKIRGGTGNASQKITFITESIGGVPSSYYNGSGFFIGGKEAVGNGSFELDKYKRFIGYDPHFTAYGNAAIGLWAPAQTPDFAQNFILGLQVNDSNGSAKEDIELSEVINQTYIGSSNPKLVYDNTKDRFGWADFYTPEYVGSYAGAGDDPDNNPVTDGKELVYKINKRLRKQSCCPGMGPYPDMTPIKMNRTKFNSSKPLQTTTTNFDLPNRNIFPFSIMDCHSGICISDFGINKDQWDDSLMGILGFSYEQLQSDISETNTLQNRVNTFNQNKLNKVTTQAIIKAEDTLIYNQSLFGAVMYKPDIFTAMILQDLATGTKQYEYTTPISVATNSLTITADNVPKQMLNPFFSIRSDLIDDTSAYLGSRDSGQRMPTMGTVLKNYSSGDYFYSSGDGITFTITKPKIITSITTSINDPDGSFCRLDDSSAVIYKIEKRQMYPVNLVQQFFGKK